MMTAPPRASIVMTVYNDLRFLDAAVESVLRQDVADFEFIIVDDGTGETVVFDALQRRDPRIRVVVSPANLGASAAANLGIEHARSEIILRFDGDDICMPDRLGRTLTAFERNPDVGLIGSAAEFIDEKGVVVGRQTMPQSDLEIRWTILFHNPYYHSTVAFRRQHFERVGRYRPEERVSNDHYLWFDMLPHCRALNLAETLAQYRWNPRGLTWGNAVKPRNRTHRIREALWERLGLTYDLYDDNLAADISTFVRGELISDPARRLPAYEVILKVTRPFLRLHAARYREDKAAAKRFGQQVVTRMLHEPPATAAERSRLYRLCFGIAPRTTAMRWMVERTRALSPLRFR